MGEPLKNESSVEEIKPVEEAKIAKFTEFETKYNSDITQLSQFKNIVGALPDLLEFTYAEGPDTYFVRPDRQDGSFGRYRVATHPHETKYAQWTTKYKPAGAKTNVSRLEYNWRVDGTPSQEIIDGAIADGWTYNFRIVKQCHIYRFAPVTLVFYSVKEDGVNKEDYYVEIEITEETIHELTEDQAWEIIKKYEKILEPIGVNAQKRLRRSLFEMYRKEIKKET